jgi:hypothetical protein
VVVATTTNPGEETSQIEGSIRHHFACASGHVTQVGAIKVELHSALTVTGQHPDDRFATRLMTIMAVVIVMAVMPVVIVMAVMPVVVVMAVMPVVVVMAVMPVVVVMAVMAVMPVVVVMAVMAIVVVVAIGAVLTVVLNFNVHPHVATETQASAVAISKVQNPHAVILPPMLIASVTSILIVDNEEAPGSLTNIGAVLLDEPADVVWEPLQINVELSLHGTAVRVSRKHLRSGSTQPVRGPLSILRDPDPAFATLQNTHLAQAMLLSTLFVVPVHTDANLTLAISFVRQIDNPSQSVDFNAFLPTLVKSGKRAEGHLGTLVPPAIFSLSLVLHRDFLPRLEAGQLLLSAFLVELNLVDAQDAITRLQACFVSPASGHHSTYDHNAALECRLNPEVAAIRAARSRCPGRQREVLDLHSLSRSIDLLPEQFGLRTGLFDQLLDFLGGRFPILEGRKSQRWRAEKETGEEQLPGLHLREPVIGRVERSDERRTR